VSETRLPLPFAVRANLTRNHSYVWGDDVAKAKTQCESLDYLFQLAVEMHKLGIPWVKEASS